MTRSALVTGGNRGIGLAVARELASAGDAVAVTYREKPPAEELLAVSCDVTDAAAVDRAFTQVEQAQGPVEVLVANAGITRDTLLATMTEEVFTEVLDTNLTGVYRVTKRAVRGMIRRRYGRIVIVSSIVGAQGAAGQANYAAAKAGLVGFARSVAREVGSRGITVNVVAPGYVTTDMTASLPTAVQEATLGAIPLRRYAAAEDVARVVRFLASDDAAYLTGVVLPVDGGLSMGS